MPRLRAVWATVEFFLAIAAAGWGVYLAFATHEAAWAGGNVAAAIFLLVAAVLFGRNHPDGRVVAAFGAAVFLITNALLVYQLLNEGLSRAAFQRIDDTFPGDAKTQFAWLLGAIMALIGIPQLMIVLFGHRPPRDAPDPYAPTPPQGSP